MKKQIYVDGQEVLTDNLNDEQTAKELEIKDRQTSYFTDGILLSIPGLTAGTVLSFIVTASATAGAVNVNRGKGYVDGELIDISDANVVYNSTNPATTTSDGIGGYTLTPQSTGSKAIPIPINTTRFVGIKYLLTCDVTKFSYHPYTSKK